MDPRDGSADAEICTLEWDNGEEEDVECHACGDDSGERSCRGSWQICGCGDGRVDGEEGAVDPLWDRLAQKQGASEGVLSSRGGRAMPDEERWRHGKFNHR